MWEPASMRTAAMAADRRLPRWAAWALAAAFLVTAWFVALATPGEEQAQSPFVVTAAIGCDRRMRRVAASTTSIARIGANSAFCAFAESGAMIRSSE